MKPLVWAYDLMFSPVLQVVLFKISWHLQEEDYTPQRFYCINLCWCRNLWKYINKVKAHEELLNLFHMYKEIIKYFNDGDASETDTILGISQFGICHNDQSQASSHSAFVHRVCPAVLCRTWWVKPPHLSVCSTVTSYCQMWSLHEIFCSLTTSLITQAASLDTVVVAPLYLTFCSLPPATGVPKGVPADPVDWSWHPGVTQGPQPTG